MWILSNSAAETVYCGAARITQLWPYSPVQAGYHLGLYRQARAPVLFRGYPGQTYCLAPIVWPAGTSECWGELQPRPFAICLREQLCPSTEPNGSQCSLSVSSDCHVKAWAVATKKPASRIFPLAWQRLPSSWIRRGRARLGYREFRLTDGQQRRLGCSCRNGVSSSAKPNRD